METRTEWTSRNSFSAFIASFFFYLSRIVFDFPCTPYLLLLCTDSYTRQFVIRRRISFSKHTLSDALKFPG